MSKEQPIDFIDIEKRNDIESILKQIKKKKLNLQIWQKEVPLRLKADGKLLDVNSLRNTIMLCSDDMDGFLDFKCKDVYFYSNHRNMIFKSTVRAVDDGNKIEMTFPEVVKIEEARAEERKYFGIKSLQRLDIMAVDQNGAKHVIPELNMVDCSKNGLGFLIPKAKATALYKGGKVVTLMCTVDGMEKRAGIIRSINPFQNNLTGESLYRVGIELIKAEIIKKEG